jgi:hypothetical protein
MAQTKKKRRRKHRGTQGGRIDTRPARGRARSRAEAQNRARSRTKKKSGPKVPDPPSWGSAAKKAIIATLLFIGLLSVFGQNPVVALVSGLIIGVFMYLPGVYLLDRFMYQRHLRKEAQKRQEREAQRSGGPRQSEG